MCATVRRAEYYYATFENKSGVARGLMDLFQKKGVQLVAFTAFPTQAGLAQIDFFAEKPNALRAALAEVGVQLIGPRYAFLIQGADDIGAVVEHHKALADAGINVIAANGVTDNAGRFGYVLWVAPEDYEKAAEALGV